METVFATAREKMGKTISVLKSEYSAVVRGAQMPPYSIKSVWITTVCRRHYQMAAISGAEARILNIHPWDISTLHPLEKAIQASDLGINPQNDGRVIRLIFPQQTEDRRKELVREINKMAEDAKVAVRSIRRDGIEKLKKMQKASEITEDDLKDGEKELQDITDEFVKEIDAVASAKEKEVMEI
jgi:ribosome recycling factor